LSWDERWQAYVQVQFRCWRDLLSILLLSFASLTNLLHIVLLDHSPPPVSACFVSNLLFFSPPYSQSMALE
jgi:hypothetical protein